MHGLWACTPRSQSRPRTNTPNALGARCLKALVANTCTTTQAGQSGLWETNSLPARVVTNCSGTSSSCAAAIDLAAIGSPYSGTTVGKPNAFTPSCYSSDSDAGEQMFFLDVQPGKMFLLLFVCLPLVLTRTPLAFPSLKWRRRELNDPEPCWRHGLGSRR